MTGIDLSTLNSIQISWKHLWEMFMLLAFRYVQDLCLQPHVQDSGMHIYSYLKGPKSSLKCLFHAQRDLYIYIYIYIYHPMQHCKCYYLHYNNCQLLGQPNVAPYPIS